MGKRSPILGYNHNVRYRGLVFHVQTEDSGVSQPHLFTHLFHHGVIVSTRKLVYDSGSAEESIKSLMQAQHKAVLKDLRRGHYDDKIDSYLGGTPGLLPRGAEEAAAAARPSEVELAPPPGTVEEAPAPPAEQALPVLPIMTDELSAPVMIVEKTPPPRPAMRAIPEPALRQRPALPFSKSQPLPVETTLKPDAPASEPTADEIELAPELEIELEIDENDEAVPARRAARDTDMQPPLGEARLMADTLDERGKAARGVVAEEHKRPASISDGVPSVRPSTGAIPPPLGTQRPAERPSNPINAAALPPARPIARPPSRPALSAPQVVSRPVMSDDRNRRDSEAVEVYSPALPSAELPGERTPGQYAQHKKSGRIPVDAIKNERSGAAAVPAGLGPPRRIGSAPSVARPNAALPPSGSAPTSVPREAMPRAGGNTEPMRSRVPTPSRLPAQGAPNRPAAHAGSGVVMTRSAVVGAPSKTSATIPRIRKAREDEGRGFGQGLISEKSLDEVILAYLSEDADEK